MNLGAGSVSSLSWNPLAVTVVLSVPVVTSSGPCQVHLSDISARLTSELSWSGLLLRWLSGGLGLARCLPVLTVVQVLLRLGCTGVGAARPLRPRARMHGLTALLTSWLAPSRWTAMVHGGLGAPGWGPVRQRLPLRTIALEPSGSRRSGTRAIRRVNKACAEKRSQKERRVTDPVLPVLPSRSSRRPGVSNVSVQKRMLSPLCPWKWRQRVGCHLMVRS